MNYYIDTINGIILFLTLLSIIWYSYETRKLRVANKEFLRIEISRREPHVIAYFDSERYRIFLVISNEGESLAKNIIMKINPALDLGNEKVKEYFLKNAINQNGIHLAPNREYRILIGHTTSSSGLYKTGEIPSKYSISLEYENISGKKFSQNLELAIDQFFNRLIEPESDVVHQLKELNDNIKKLVSIFNQKYNDEN